MAKLSCQKPHLLASLWLKACANDKLLRWKWQLCQLSQMSFTLIPGHCQGLKNVWKYSLYSYHFSILCSQQGFSENAVMTQVLKIHRCEFGYRICWQKLHVSTAMQSAMTSLHIAVDRMKKADWQNEKSSSPYTKSRCLIKLCQLPVFYQMNVMITGFKKCSNMCKTFVAVQQHCGSVESVDC